MSLSSDEFLFADVVERLRAAAQQDRPIEAAQVHLINLQEIIRGAGPRWPLIKDNIRLGSMRFLKGSVGDSDIVIPAGDGFLIIFADGRPEEMKARAEDLRALLMAFYLGQQSPARDLKVSIEHRSVQAREIGVLIAAAAKPAEGQSTECCIFAPAWSPGPQLVANYFCVPVHHEIGGGLRFGYDPDYVETGVHAQRDYLQLDIAMLDTIEEALARHEVGGGLPVLGASVHSTTMQSRTARAVFLDRLSRLPPESMKHLYIEISEIEPGAPNIHIAEWAGFLRAKVRTIMLELHHSLANPPNLDDVGVWGAGYQAPAAINRQDGDAEPHLRQIRRWGESLARQKKRFFIDNLNRPALVRVAAEAGVAFITSDTFWPARKWPGGVISTPMPEVTPFPVTQRKLSAG